MRPIATAAAALAGAVLILPVAAVSPAFAQAPDPIQSAQELTERLNKEAAEGGGGAPGGGAQPGAGGHGAAQPGPTPGSTTSQAFGVVAPLKPGQTLGGGNVTSSSSRPKLGNETDGFDITPRGAGQVSVRGSGTGPIFAASESTTLEGERAPGRHVVKKGDTLWGICDQYFQNPYQWPRVWSYNPHIQNPHWIEVGDQVQLRPALAAGERGAGAGSDGAGTGAFVDARRSVPSRTIFLREQGFIENEALESWAEITGAPEDKMFMMETDEVYLRIAPEKDVRVGQELTVFRPVRSAGTGKIVQIQGTVRINAYNVRDRIARATVVEALDVIERGARLGAIPRRFEVVPPVRNEKDVAAKILASVQFHNFYGQNQVVYIDKGSDDGLQPGNRLLAMRRGDAWRQSLPTASAAKRIALESDSPAQVEVLPPPRDEKNYPEEVVGELRVLTTKAKTAMCLVTQSSREIELHEAVIARRGY